MKTLNELTDSEVIEIAKTGTAYNGGGNWGHKDKNGNVFT